MNREIGKSKLKVLVADDDSVVRQAFKSFLRDRGYEVVTVADGSAALEAAFNAFPDVIFLDVIMPRIDGFEALKQLREHRQTRDIPVIIVTANADTGTLTTALSLGADAFLAKPFLRSDLLRTINYAMMDRRQRKIAAEETFLRHSGQSQPPKIPEDKREEFIVNFEIVYLNMVSLISQRDQSALKETVSKLLDAAKFYGVKGVRKKFLQMLLAVNTGEWDKAADLLELIYTLFKDIRRTIPETFS